LVDKKKTTGNYEFIKSFNRNKIKVGIKEELFLRHDCRTYICWANLVLGNGTGVFTSHPTNFFCG
jgi:hypothetical protein